MYCDYLSLDGSGETLYSVNNVVIEESEISLLLMAGFGLQEGLVIDSRKVFSFNDITVRDCDYSANDNPVSVIELVYFHAPANVFISFNEITMTNLIFHHGSAIARLQHSSIEETTFNDVTISGIRNGRFVLENVDKTTHAQLVAFIDATAKNNSDADSSLLVVKENSRLRSLRCTFEENFSFANGGVLSASQQNSQVTFTNSTFKNNYAMKGGESLFTNRLGVFNLNDQSFVECDDCLIDSNFAMLGAVASTDNNAILILKRSTITANRAINGKSVYSDDLAPITMSVNSLSNPLVVDSTLLEANEAMSDEGFMIEAYKCSNLCFLQQSFLINTLKTLKQIVFVESDASFILIKAILRILGDTRVHLQKGLVTGFFSDLNVESTDVQFQVQSLINYS